jgi:hypothetical protein
VTVELVLRVRRDERGRLNGTVRVGSGSTLRAFSGTLELMRVFEEVVPADVRRDATGASQLPSSEEMT